MYSIYCHVTEDEAATPRMYVGTTSQEPAKRWAGGEGYRTSPKFYKHIKRNGWGGVSHYVVAQGLTQAEAYEMERELIGRMRLTELGYNVAPGGSEPWNKGKRGVFSPEALKRIALAKIGNAHHGKPCRCIETGEEFRSITEARKAFGMTRNSIAKAFRSEEGGIHFEEIGEGAEHGTNYRNS